MTTFAWPTLSANALPRALEFALQSNTQSFASPLSGAVQTVEMPGARWHLAFTLDDLLAPDAALMRSWLARLRGQSGRFYMHHLAFPTPRGPATGAPVVNGAGQVGASLATSGWTPNTVGILKEGDFFGVNGELKILVADASSNGAGQATLTFEPPLRSSPANAATITTTKPTATFKMDEDASRWVTNAPFFNTFTIAATEAW